MEAEITDEDVVDTMAGDMMGSMERENDKVYAVYDSICEEEHVIYYDTYSLSDSLKQTIRYIYIYEFMN